MYVYQSPLIMLMAQKAAGGFLSASSVSGAGAH